MSTGSVISKWVKLSHSDYLNRPTYWACTDSPFLYVRLTKSNEIYVGKYWR